MEEGRTRTVLLPDGRDPERYLRVTWHPDSQTVVFSHWHGAVCAASTPVPLADASRLVDLLSGVLRSKAAERDEDTIVMRMPRRAAAGTGRSGTNEGGE